MKGVLHVLSTDLDAVVEGIALANLIRLERLLKAHAEFEEYLNEENA